MIDDLAMRISAAYSRTRISAMLIEASQVALAIAIDEAFGLATVYIGIADERRYARAFGYTVNRGANSVLAAR